MAFPDVVLPSLSAQVGGTVAPHLALRGTVDALLFWFTFIDVGADVLYTTAPTAGPIWYVGGGPQLYYASLSGAGEALVGGIHLTGGAEFPIDPTTGAYVELDPGMPFTFTGVLINVRTGIDFHF